MRKTYLGINNNFQNVESYFHQTRNISVITETNIEGNNLYVNRNDSKKIFQNKYYVYM